jgi:hypothetical protein
MCSVLLLTAVKAFDSGRIIYLSPFLGGERMASHLLDILRVGAMRREAGSKKGPKFPGNFLVAQTLHLKIITTVL